LAAAEDRAQRNDHDLDEIMKPGVAGCQYTSWRENIEFHCGIMEQMHQAMKSIT
jgi:hypothetical protein